MDFSCQVQHKSVNVTKTGVSQRERQQQFSGQITSAGPCQTQTVITADKQREEAGMQQMGQTLMREWRERLGKSDTEFLVQKDLLLEHNAVGNATGS